jgi:hypothetical protein
MPVLATSRIDAVRPAGRLDRTTEIRLGRMARANSMSNTDRDQEIRNRAYLLWEKAGRPTGQEHDFWAEAAREIEGADKSEDEASSNRFKAR